MLRGIAEYAMSGRRQAATATVLLGLIPILGILSATLVALITLRKGFREGFLLLLWALLPALLQAQAGDFSAIFLATAALLLAYILRKTESWQLILVALTTLAGLTQLSLVWQESYIDQAVSTLDLLIPAGNFADPAITNRILLEELLHYYGAYHGIAFLVILSWARHWQASLYHPGGFQREFHALRIDPKLGLLLGVGIVLGLSEMEPLNQWLPLFAVAPLTAALGFCHWLAHRTGKFVLVLTYLALFFMSPVLVSLSFVDSALDLRNRWKLDSKH